MWSSLCRTLWVWGVGVQSVGLTHCNLQGPGWAPLEHQASRARTAAVVCKSTPFTAFDLLPQFTLCKTARLSYRVLWWHVVAVQIMQ
jgi:hypothetical protein